MRQFNEFRSLYLSFFSRALYRDVGKNWKGIGLLYLLLLFSIVSLIKIFEIQSDINHFVAEDAPSIVSQLPTITIKQGQLSIDKESPYLIRDVEEGGVLAIIDTTGQYHNLEETPAVILLTTDKVHIRMQSNEVQVHQINEKMNSTIDQSSAINFLDKIKRFAVYALYPLLVAFAFSFALVQIFFLGFMAKLFSKIADLPIKYLTLVRLAAIAITPVIILRTVLLVFDVFLPYQGMLSLLITMGYLYFGVMAQKQL